VPLKNGVYNTAFQPLFSALALFGPVEGENIATLAKPRKNPNITEFLSQIIYSMSYIFRAVLFYILVLFETAAQRFVFYMFRPHIVAIIRELIYKQQQIINVSKW
jgi:hypothetical protein